MEYKIGDTFYLEDGTKLEIVKSALNCRGCYFFNDKDKSCSKTKDIICYAPRRKDKEFVIFKQIKDNNNMKKKMTIDIYTVMQTSKKDRDLCYNFTSFKEANNQFEKFLKMWEKANKVKPKGWTSPAAPYQLKVSRIGDITLYLCKESIEIDIKNDSNKQSSEIYKKDVLGKWINVDDINPIEIKDLKLGDCAILRVKYDDMHMYNYKIAYVNYLQNGQVTFHIQDMNISKIPIKVTDFCILPDYISDNFYKTNK